MAELVGHGRKNAELGLEVVIDRHDRRHITAPVAVVGRRPDGDDGLVREVELDS